MTEKLIYTLSKNGYMEMISRGEKTGYRIFYDMTASLINSVIFVDAIDYSDEFIKNFKETLSSGMGAKNLSSHFFIILLIDSHGETYTEQISVAHQVCDGNPFVWIYDEAIEELIVFENQAEEFYGLRRLVEQAKNVSEEDLQTAIEIKAEMGAEPSKKEVFRNVIKELPKVTASLVLINVIVYIICAFTGNLLYNKGGVGLRLVSTPDQWYRLISYMFLHANEVHLFGNMLLLYCVGDIVEKKFKPILFSILYFSSGIWACIATFINEMITEEYIIMVGASGAIFGLLGALLALVLFKRINRDYMKLRRVIWAIFLAVYSGFASGASIANWAHVGGLVSGFLIGLVYCLITLKKTAQGITDED